MLNYIITSLLIIIILLIISILHLQRNEQFSFFNDINTTDVDKIERAKIFCKIWKKNPNVNPETQKEIDVTKPTYNSIKNICDDVRFQVPEYTGVLKLLHELRIDDNIYPENEYDRNYFYSGWYMMKDNCTVRDNVLSRESKNPILETMYENGSKCTVEDGLWKNIYTGQGTGNILVASDIDIDHMVPLKNAWISGAYRWNKNQLVAYANDMTPGHLKAISKESNRSKSDKSPFFWMPEPVSEWCKYVADWIAVKHRWDLSVTSYEKDKLINILNNNCNGVNIAEPSAPTSYRGVNLDKSVNYPERLMSYHSDDDLYKRIALYRKYNSVCNNPTKLQQESSNINKYFNTHKKLYGIYNPNSPSNKNKYNSDKDKCNLLASPLPNWAY